MNFQAYFMSVWLIFKHISCRVVESSLGAGTVDLDFYAYFNLMIICLISCADKRTTYKVACTLYRCSLYVISLFSCDDSLHNLNYLKKIQARMLRPVRPGAGQHGAGVFYSRGNQPQIALRHGQECGGETHLLDIRSGWDEHEGHLCRHQLWGFFNSYMYFFIFWLCSW